jgi:hypothetical protein
MKPVYLKFLPAVLSAGLIGLTGCNNEYSLENEEVVSFRHAYEDNFVKAFGSIDPNQSWDFSSYAKQKRQSESQTRAVTQYVSVAKTDGNHDGWYDGDEWYDVEDNTLAWLETNLKEHENHLGQMKSSTFRTEESTVFEVVPIYQGEAALIWELHIRTKVDGSSEWTDTNLWEKGKDMQEYSDGGWHAVGSGNKTCNSMDAEHIKAKPIRVDIPAKCSFYFYLYNLSTTEDAPQLNAAVGQMNSSIDNPAQIAVLKNLDRPGNIPSDYKAYVLGCEDMKYGGEYVDMDYNDMVFLLVGYIPEVIYYETEEETIIRKRYLIEDFGGFDYDFNDIIVDVAQTTTTKYKVNSETLTKELLSEDVGQKATISYFCGTMPVQVKVGDTFFGQVTDPTADAAIVETQLARDPGIFDGPVCTRTVPPTGTTVNYTKEVTGWNPDLNYISVYVWTKKNPWVARPSVQTDDIWTTTGIWTSTFPENGAVPYIIAVDQGVWPIGEGVKYSGIYEMTE